MFFKDVKQNYPVFILDKQELKVIQGKVVSAAFPRIDMNGGARPNPASINPTNPTGALMVVDVTIEADGKTATYTIPENLAVTYAGNIVLSTDREGLVREIEAMKNAAEQILSTVDHQKAIVEKASSLLAELNPLYKEKRETEERFGKIEGTVAEMKEMLASFIKEFKS
jgi:hypothetical protein